MPRLGQERRRARIVKDASAPYSKKTHERRPGNATKKSWRHPTDADAASNQLRLNELKKRMRDLIRLMQHKHDMGPGERQHRERELSALRADLVGVLHQKARKDMISRYHMVRFFERRKAERILKQAQKQAAAAPPDSSDREGLKDRVHEAEVNLNYTLYHPLEYKYISLYDTKNKDGQQHGAGFKSSMWHEVANAAGDSELQSLRDRKDCLQSAQHKVEEIVTRFKDVRGPNTTHHSEDSISQDERKKKNVDESDEDFFDEG